MCVGTQNVHDSLACGTTAERLALMLPGSDAPGRARMNVGRGTADMGRGRA
jgi:hypothetical protein